MSTSTLPAIDPFKYFGSRIQVRERFAAIIKNSLHKISGYHTALLSEEMGLEKGTITDIVNGRLDVLNHQVVETLADVLDFGIEEGFASFGEFPEDEQEAWRAVAEAEEFCFIAGADDKELSDLDQLKLFVLLQAFRQL